MADDGTTILIRSIETFSKRLYFTIAYEKANYYISPFCIHAMLSMLCAGSQGDTQQELHRLQYLENQQVHPNAYRNIFHNLLDVTNFKLELYNKICMQEKYHLLDSFKTLIANDYIAEIDLINFINNINMTHRINSWCELRTASKIRDLVIASDFDALTRMVLLSAAFFGGNWLYDFPVSSTKTGSFNLTHTNSVGCEMMSIGGHLYYTENKELRSEILKLPFVNQRFSMLILLPTSVYGIEYLERQLRHVTFRELIGTLDNTDHVEVLLPKFKIEYKINLTDNLRMMGMVNSYSDLADFHNIVAPHPDNLRLSKIIQKCSIGINEFGVDAASVGGSEIPSRNPTTRSAHIHFFTANRPFMFALLLQHREDYLPMFIGKVMKP